MSGRLQGKVAMITGAAQGLGSAHLIRLAEEGAALVAIDRQSPEAAPFAEGIAKARAAGATVLAYAADVTDLAALEQIAEAAGSELGGIDILVANAGIFPAPGPITEMRPEDWAATLAVNLTGTWNAVRAALPQMRKRGGGGAIILTSSPYGLKGIAGGAHYAASKHGVVGLMRSLALELGAESIRVNTVHPTTVDTPLLRAVLPEGASEAERAAAVDGFNVLPVPWIEPGEVSNAIVFLASDEGRFITGVTLPIDAGALVK